MWWEGSAVENKALQDKECQFPNQEQENAFDALQKLIEWGMDRKEADKIENALQTLKKTFDNELQTCEDAFLESKKEILFKALNDSTEWQLGEYTLNGSGYLIFKNNEWEWKVIIASDNYEKAEDILGMTFIEMVDKLNKLKKAESNTGWEENSNEEPQAWVEALDDGKTALSATYNKLIEFVTEATLISADSVDTDKTKALSEKYNKLQAEADYNKLITWIAAFITSLNIFKWETVLALKTDYYEIEWERYLKEIENASRAEEVRDMVSNYNQKQGEVSIHLIDWNYEEAFKLMKEAHDYIKDVASKVSVKPKGEEKNKKTPQQQKTQLEASKAAAVPDVVESEANPITEVEVPTTTPTQAQQGQGSNAATQQGVSQNQSKGTNQNDVAPEVNPDDVIDDLADRAAPYNDFYETRTSGVENKLDNINLNSTNEEFAQAVAAYQAGNKLKIDGMVGPRTLDHMWFTELSDQVEGRTYNEYESRNGNITEQVYAKLNIESTVSPSSKEFYEAVKTKQLAYNTQNPDKQLDVDGKFGPMTRKAFGLESVK